MLNCPNRKRGKAMKVNIRKWELADAKDLATAISNKKVQDNPSRKLS